MSHVKELRVKEGKSVDFRTWPTAIAPVYESKKDYESILARHIARLSEQQQLLYATNSHAVLVIFQGMDAAGKDGAIKYVMSGVNPQGCQVYSFKQPSREELQHDFMWRSMVRMPERGRIGIFNRSYYEEVLVTRVHPELLVNEAIPDIPSEHSKIWRHRYRSINNVERHLHTNGTRIIKFFLHLSKDEQRKRLLERIDDPHKNWKFSLADVQERNFWDRYITAYEECLAATSTDDAPWFVIPADDKENARLLISEILLDRLEDMKMHYPQAGSGRQHELHEIRRKLME